MNMEPNLDNVNLMFTATVPQARIFIPKVVDKLNKPDVPVEFADEYVRALLREWSRQVERRLGHGWTETQRIFVDSGLMEALAQIILSPREELKRIKFNALEAIQPLAKIGNLNQRRKLRGRLRKINALNELLLIAHHGEYAVLRAAAVNILRVLCVDLFLGETLSVEQTADLVESLCRFVLEGSDRISEEMLDPAANWQSKIMTGTHILKPQDAAKYAKRYNGMSQENCLFAVHALFCRVPTPSRDFMLQVIQTKPEIVDMLLQCASMRRPGWYPENQVDGIASETLALLFQFPLDTVPGLELPLPEKHKRERAREFRETVEAYKTLITRPQLVDKLIGIWKKVNEETPAVIRGLFSRVRRDWFATVSPGQDALQEACKENGQTRVSMLRLITGISYLDQQDISEATLLSLLPIAHSSSRKALSSGDLQSLSTPDEFLSYLSYIESVQRGPVWAGELNEDTEEPERLPSTATAGPIATIRILTRLQELGTLDTIQSWTEVPQGLPPSISLVELKEMTSQASIEKVLRVAIEQAAFQIEMADTSFMRSTGFRQAWHDYVSVAELTQAMKNFDDKTGGKYSHLLRDLNQHYFTSLSSASKCFLAMKWWESALGFAKAAAAVAGPGAAATDGITSIDLQKNRQVIKEASKKVRG
ncbi:hypothetical protein K474DRAFT_884553 [Panus rudis PR-1116 ss-1]|nr:hypothetical protein K474DRAFT_884553 [Panus rudis PR-1116 ss-1]